MSPDPFPPVSDKTPDCQPSRTGGHCSGWYGVPGERHACCQCGDDSADDRPDEMCAAPPAPTPEPQGRSVVHALPPHGSANVPCCDRSPFDLPDTDRIAIDGAAVSCPGRPSPDEAYRVAIAASAAVRNATPPFDDGPPSGHGVADGTAT